MKKTLVSVYFTFVVLLFAACSVREVFSELPVTSIIRGYGYPCVEYSAITPDGYVLAMQRIPHGINNQRATKGVVLFQHGLTDNANGAVLNNPQESLPFILADNGYDVWLGNNRGNGYSMTSINWNTNQAQFWQFSFDEMASMDLPTEIDFALKTSGARTLSYIGHSEGTIQAFAGFENATVASKVNIFIALAPVAYVYHQESLIIKALALLDTGEILALLGDHEFYLPTVLHKLLPDACVISPQACAFIVEFVAGPSQNLNDSRLSYYLDYEPNPTSVFNMIHWSQMVKAEAFQKFDYGRQGNIAHYGQPTPPQYDLGKVTLPVALFTGSNDYLADPEDVERLIGELPTPPVLVHNEPTYAHLDPLLAPSARTKIYPLVLNLLAKYSSAL